MADSLRQNIFIQYLAWHFLETPKKILKAWRNLFSFTLEYFSVFLLLKTFFSHWRRYAFSYPRSFDVRKYIQVFFSNLISRILGAVLRSFLIILGILIEILIFFFGMAIFLGWLLLPFLLILIFYFGLSHI